MIGEVGAATVDGVEEVEDPVGDAVAAVPGPLLLEHAANTRPAADPPANLTNCRREIVPPAEVGGFCEEGVVLILVLVVGSGQTRPVQVYSSKMRFRWESDENSMDASTSLGADG